MTVRQIVWLVVGLFLVSCGGGGGGGNSSAGGEVEIAWDANRDSAVNAPGGGYRVYYSSVAGFRLADAAVIDVPYTAGGTPTRVVVTLPDGQHYIKIVAYSALNPAGSEPSAEIEVQ